MQTFKASNVRVDDITSEYESRSMGDVPDVQFVAAISDVVQRPRAGEFNSFVLHAQLELAARAALLPNVSPSVRFRARLRMLSLAARYEAFAPAVAAKNLDSSASVTQLVEAVEAGDSDLAEAAARQIGAVFSRSEVVAALVDFVVPLTSAAAHGSIFLHLLQRSDPRGSITPSLLAPLARELARDNGKAIHWAESRTATHRSDPRQLERRLRSVPSVDMQSTFIHPIMEAADTSGLAESVLNEAVGQFDRSSASAILRVAAESMIHDTPTHAPYGWTHCLTLPQAVIEIAHSSRRPDTALAIAATHVVGFRAALGQAELPDRPADSYPAVDMGPVIDAAASHHDAHVAKYVLACLDAAAYDSEARNLYHAAAAHLLEVWETLPLDDDPLAEPKPE